MSAATTVTETASCWTMGRNVSVCRVFPIRCCAGGSRWPSCRWTRPCAPRSPKAGTRSNAAPSAGRRYTQLQPSQILPGLRGAGAPEERGGTPAEKIPPVYAFRAVKVHGNQGFFRMVGRQVDKVILFPSKRGSKCGKMDKKEAPGQRQLFRSLSRLNDFGMDTDFVQCYN